MLPNLFCFLMVDVGQMLAQQTQGLAYILILHTGQIYIAFHSQQTFTGLHKKTHTPTIFFHCLAKKKKKSSLEINTNAELAL